MRTLWTVAAVALIVTAACGGQTASRSSQSTLPPTAASASPSPSPLALPTATALPTEKPADEIPPAAGPRFSCEGQTGGPGQVGPPSVLQDARVGRHDGEGFDRFVLEFDAPTWTYDLFPQGNQFTRDPSGLPVTLLGSAGLEVVVHNAANHNEQGQPVETVLNSVPNYPTMKQVTQVGDFEGVLTWGLGVEANHCFRSFVLTSPSRLVIDVQQ